MTEEERYQQIVDSRKAEPESDGTQSGVKSDPPDTKASSTENTETAQQAEGKTDEKATNAPTPEEKQQHALAAMRVRFKRENDALRREIAELKKASGASAGEKPKTRADFKDDAEYGNYLRQNMEDSIYRRIRERMDGEMDQDSAKAAEARKLSEGLESVQKGLAETVMRELQDPESEMSLILTDERGKALTESIAQSPHKAEILAVMFGKPKLFSDLLELSPQKQQFRIFQLEDKLEAMKAESGSRAKAEDERRKRADSVPTAGAFGVNGNGQTNIGSLSASERIKRYKADMRKSGII